MFPCFSLKESFDALTTSKCLFSCNEPNSFFRIAAEQRIRDLQDLIDETFQQFALDDSEDEFEDENSPPLLDGSDIVSSFQYNQQGSHPFLNLPATPPNHKVLTALKQYSSSPALTLTKH